MKKALAVVFALLCAVPMSAQVHKAPESIKAGESVVFLVANGIYVEGRFYDKTSNRSMEEFPTGVYGTAFQVSATDVLTVDHVFKDVVHLAQGAFAKAEGNLRVHGIKIGVWPEEITGIRHVIALIASDGTRYEFTERYTATWTEGAAPTEENIRAFISSIAPDTAPIAPAGFTVVARDDTKDIALLRLAQPREQSQYISLPLPFAETDLDAGYWGLSARTGRNCDPFCFNAWKGTIESKRPSTYNVNDDEWKEAESWHLKMLTRPGDSGGPVVDEQLTLLGLTNAGDAFANMMTMFDISKPPMDRLALTTEEINAFLDEHR